MNNSLKISIITVVYNSISTIENTILSVINQSYKNIEYIVIDGGSTDGTIDVINKYSDKISYWVSESDEGIYDAMNKGALKATGNYIQYLNSSDRLFNNSIIETIVKYIIDKTPDIVYGDIIMEKKFGCFHMIPKELNEFKNCFPLYHPSLLVKASLIKKYKFDIKYKIAADFDLLRRLYYNDASFKYIPVIFTLFEGYNGVSSTNLYKNWIECQYIINANHKFGWPLKKYTFFLKNIIREVYYKLMAKQNVEYQNFIKDPRIINVIKHCCE